ncbi:signal peptidase II [Streptomyces sp. NBC_00838]|uniref:signal peptidase II n=1 Tax=Streptomyces sp. NBC_00838 TaxID=2903680 RepID=UPI00386F3412|nr:signal peptidase II [Streptomyces sp. NBC_00838]
MNSNDEPEAAKTVPATDAPGVRGGAAAPRGSANAADAATEAPAAPGAPGGVGPDGTIGRGPADAAGVDVAVGHAIGTSDTGGAPAGTTATTVEADRTDTGTGTSAAGAADTNASDATNPAAPDTASTVAPASTNSVATGTANPAASAGTADTDTPDAADPAAPDPADLGSDSTSGTGDTADTASAPAAADPAAPDPADPDTTRTAPPTRRLFWSTLGVALVLLIVDQASKWWAVGALGDSESIDVVGDVIRFWLVYNPGAAFSMGTGVTWVFTIFAGVAVVAIAWYAWRVRSTPWAYALGLLLGGATSHFGDRLFREPGFARGHVVDFIDYAGFFVGNVADIGIFAGAVSIVVLSFKGIEAVDRDAVDKPAD